MTINTEVFQVDGVKQTPTGRARVTEVVQVQPDVVFPAKTLLGYDNAGDILAGVGNFVLIAKDNIDTTGATGPTNVICYIEGDFWYSETDLEATEVLMDGGQISINLIKRAIRFSDLRVVEIGALDASSSPITGVTA